MRHRQAWAAVFLLALIGCGGPSNAPPTPAVLEENALGEVGEMYRLYSADKKKPPASLADFTPMEMMSPAGVRAIKTGEIIVCYGATLPDTDEGIRGSSDEVLAYLKSVPVSGGQVLMLNREVKTMTAEQFKAAKLAGTASSADDGKAKPKS
jgi:hypothetical protein